MNISKKLINAFATVALASSMTLGIAAAQPADSDSDDTVVNVNCAETATVDVDVIGTFQVDTSSGASSYDAHLPGGFEITLDLTCNWSNDFQVSAEIEPFMFDGTAPGGAVDQFSGTHLYLDGMSSTYNGPDIPYVAEAPFVEGTVFEFWETGDSDVIENGWDVVYWGWWPIGAVPTASPGVTVATWDGHLYNLPANLADGQYIAPLTVELTVN